MAKFMVRVELHDSETPEKYELLDTAMEKKKFWREFLGKKATYQLPCGEYWYIADATTAEVRTRAASAAEKTGQAFGIMAVRVDGWSAMGLKKSAASASE